MTIKQGNGANSKRKSLLASVSLFAAAVAPFAAAPAQAQDAPAEEEEAIVVTGSRIARANLTSPTAVTTVNAETIELSGEDNIAEVLRGVPSFGAPAFSPGNSNFLTAGNGISTLQLRNLGEDRTLVVVNGRRYVSGVPGSAAVDFNTIPTDLIERVEVITGGASAIYGADALAGVINVILRDDYEGVEYRYQYGASDHGDDVNHRFSFLAGGNFADGRGNAVVNATFTQNAGVYARDRDNTAIDDIALCAITPAIDPENCQTPVTNFFSSFAPTGRFFDFSTGESVTLSSGTGPSGTVVPWSTAQFGFNRQSQRRYSVPLERFMVAGNFRYDLTPSVEAFAETMFTHTEASSDIEPVPLQNADLSIDGIPCTNPFAPPALVSALCDGGDTAIPFTRRMTELGNRGNTVRRNSYRVLLGFRGEIADQFDWEAYYGYGRTEDALQIGGQINAANMREALNAIDLDGNPATTGDIVCANPVARAEGCVPINLFGAGSITPEAAAWARAPTQRQGLTQQEIAGATLGGRMFAMPAGDAQFSIGAEWRREQAEDVPDALTQSGQNAINETLPTIGSYRVGEIFAEAEFPLLADMPFIHELTVGAAFRWSDYSSTGETEAYTGRLQWAPTDWLRFRAQLARAVRVPNIGELFSPAGENFAPVADPCNGVTAIDVAGDIDNFCRADPNIAARIAATGSFTLSQTEIQGTGGFTGGGNPTLDPEVADSVNIGFVLNPDFNIPGGVVLSVDWYKIEIEQIIRALDRQETLALCYGAAPSSFPNEFCARLERDDAGPAFQRGELVAVNTSFFNDTVPQEFSGVDVSFSWTFALGDMVARAPGDLSLRTSWTHLLYETEDGPGDTVGEIGSAENKVQAGAIYSLGPWSFSWETNYVGDSVASLDSGPEFEFSVGDYVTHDIRIGWDVSESANFYFGSNNLLNEDAPIVLTGIPGNTIGTDTNADVYDPIGRTWYAGVRLRY